METEITKMSSKGQIVIPQRMRERLNAIEGTLFVVTDNHDTLILKKMPKPSKEELIRNIEQMAKRNTQRLKDMGITQEPDWVEIVHNHRKKKK